MTKMNLNKMAKEAICKKLQSFGLSVKIVPEQRKSFVVISKNDKTWKVRVHAGQKKNVVTKFFQKHDNTKLPSFWINVHIDLDTNLHDYFVMTPQDVENMQFIENRRKKPREGEGVDNIGFDILKPYQNRWETILNVVNNS